MRWIGHGYQSTAESFTLVNNRSGLFLDPGLGKTSISLAVIKILQAIKESNGVLIVAPVRVIYSVWPSEILKWDNFNSISHTIIHGKTKPSLWGPKKDIYLVNSEGLKSLHKQLLEGLNEGKPCPFDTLIVDESTKVKNYKAGCFKLLCDMLPLFKRRHIMTGTPAPKNYLDLWSQMYLLDDGKTLGHNYHHFRNKYFDSNDWNEHDYQIKDGAAEDIQKRISHLVLNMEAKDYLSMPPIVYNQIVITLSDKELKYYKQMEREFFIELDAMEASADQAAQVSMKCHQIANGRVYEDIPDELDDDQIKEFKKTRKVINVHEQKIKALRDLIDELSGKPLLIAYHYKHDLDAIIKAIGYKPPNIGSGVSPKKTDAIIAKWNNGELPILTAHPKSMAHGLNLQASGNDICWYSLPWSLEDYIQYNARIYRQGVKSQVRVHHLIAQSTIDQAIMMRLGERSNQQLDLRKAISSYRRLL